eukprot:TRINITY_DN8146_c0_g1_i2.p1 TRINITY_DN8146_c0_g1~~TRINITY_DN8146_c0_g1_i2.p1  ORF type:complete len:202 (+),score=24.11 TRINITY_DN8146_c0_g1_i2:30-608(+)
MKKADGEEFEVFPGILPGWADKKNSDAVAWGCQDLVAYGSQSYIVVLDPSTLSVVQTLDEHKTRVTRLAWAPQSAVEDEKQPNLIILASGDRDGNIIIWNVLMSSVIVTFYADSENARPVLDLKWHPHEDALISLHSPSDLVLWNVTSRTKQWTVTLSEPLVACMFNPFETDTLCCASAAGAVYFAKGTLFE